MARAPDRGFDIGHPAPAGRIVGPAVLLACFLGPFILWSVQIGAISTVAGLTCLTPSGLPTAEPSAGWAAPAVRWVNAGALVLTFAFLLLSVANLLRAGRVDGSLRGGVMHAGEGRVRSMAVWGVFTAALFLIAIGFNTVSAFREGLCPS